MKVIGRLGNELKFTGVFTNAIISVWKILLMYITVIIIFYINNGNTDYLFQGLPDVFSFTVNTKIYGTACPTHGLIIWQVIHGILKKNFLWYKFLKENLAKTKHRKPLFSQTKVAHLNPNKTGNHG